jgi:hypothetical protein
MFVKIMGCYFSTMTEATTTLNAEDEMMAKKSRLSPRRHAERVTIAIALVTLAL